MSTARTVLDDLLEPLGDCLTVEVAERLSALRAPASVQARIEELAQKSEGPGSPTPSARSTKRSCREPLGHG